MEIKEELLDIEGIKSSKKSLIDLFIRRTAVITQTSENLVDLMIKDQWRNANRVAQPGSEVAQIEFPHIGTFSISKNKAQRRLESLDRRIKAVEVLEPVEDKRTMNGRFLCIQRYKEQVKNIKTKIKTLD